MLLPSHVSGHLEHQRTESDNPLRWDIAGPGAITQASKAADKYIAERELSRQKIPDIPKHRRYVDADEGAAQFAGIRQVDGETLALLKRDEQIVVLPIDARTARRMRRLSVGDVVGLRAGSITVLTGRSR